MRKITASARLRHLITALVLCAGLAVPVCAAGALALPLPEPIFNLPEEADAALDITSLSNQIDTLKAINGVFSGIQNVEHDISDTQGFIGSAISDLGGGTLGGLISDINAGMSLYQQAKQTYQMVAGNPTTLNGTLLGQYAPMQLYSAVENNTLDTTNFAIANIAPINEALAGTMPAGDEINTLQTNLYLQTATPTDAQLNQLNAMRTQTAEEIDVGSLETSAAATTSSYTPLSQNITVLSNGIANSTDERGDWKANSAILIDLLQHEMAQTAILGQILETQSMGGIESYGNFGSYAGTQLSN